MRQFLGLGGRRRGMPMARSPCSATPGVTCGTCCNRPDEQRPMKHLPIPIGLALPRAALASGPWRERTPKACQHLDEAP